MSDIQRRSQKLRRKSQKGATPKNVNNKSSYLKTTLRPFAAQFGLHLAIAIPINRGTTSENSEDKILLYGTFIRAVDPNPRKNSCPSSESQSGIITKDKKYYKDMTTNLGSPRC